MVRGILNGEDGSPAPLRNAAEAAGIKLPGEDQDIGKVADPNSMEPGTVIAGKDGNYVYLGDDQVLGEDKKVKPLSEVAVFDGEHDGIFALDTGAPAGGDSGVMQVAEEKALPPQGDQPGAKPADSGPQAPGVTPPPRRPCRIRMDHRHLEMVPFSPRAPISRLVSVGKQWHR